MTAAEFVCWIAGQYDPDPPAEAQRLARAWIDKARLIRDGGSGESHAMTDQKQRGLYEKFRITRTDGRSEHGEKHEGCEYFVLDLDHDDHAIPALRAYAESCALEFPQLAADLSQKVFLMSVAAHGRGRRLSDSQEKATP